MASIKILVLIFLLSLQSYTQNPNKCCTSYDKSNLICLTCPDGTYYYGNNCIPDIDNCEDFQQCGICSKCANGFNLVDSDVSGKKVKKCQQLSSYLPIDVQKKTQQGPSYDAYIISDDYMKNIHKQLKPGKLLSAYHKSSPNAIQLIKIQYEVAQADGQSSKFYRTTMQIDLNKYQFKQIDFNEIQKTDLGNIWAEKIDGSGVKSKEKVGIDTSGGIGDTSVNGEYLEKVLDLREATNLKIVQAVDVIVRGSNLIYKKVVAVKIKTNGSGKQFIEITYLGNDENNHVFLIQAASRRVVTVDGVQVLATNSKATIQPIKKPQPIPEPMKPVLATVAPVVVSAPPATPVASPTKIVDVVNNKQTPSTLPNATPTTPPPPKPAEANVNKQPAKIPPQIINSSPPASSAPSSKQPAPTQSATQQTQQTQPTQPTPPAPPTPPSVPTTPVSQTTAAPSPDPQTGFWPKQPTSTYTKQDNIEVLKDLKFLVAKDLLNKKLQGYQDILPTSCYSKTEPNIKIFLMLFNKPQGIQTQTIVKVNFISYASELIYQHKVGIVQKPAPPSSSQSRIYTPKEIAQVIKTSYFISAAIQVSKAPNGYNSDKLISVAVNDDEPNTIYYRSVYNVNGKLYEVESLTKKKLRIGQLVSEKDVTPPGAVINLIKPKPQTKPENTDPVVNTQDQGASSPPPASSTSTSVTPISSPPAPTPPTPPTVDSNPISSPKPVNPPVTPPVPQEVKPTPPPTNSNSKTQPVNNQKPSPPTKQPEQPEKVAPVVKTPPPAPKPADCEFPKITPKFDDLLKFSPNTELPQSVLTQIGGFSQILQNAAKTDTNYLRIESFVECTSSKIIKDSQILGVFSKGSGFSSQFKIYYQTPRKVIYQVFVTIDRLKSKIYIINFNPISFGVQ